MNGQHASPSQVGDTNGVLFKSPLCQLSNKPANKFCINEACTKNAFCCKFCNDEQCYNSHMHGGKLYLKKWITMQPLLYEAFLGNENPWPEETQFDKLASSLIEQIKSIQINYRDFIASKRQQLYLKPSFRDTLDKLRKQYTDSLTGSQMASLVQAMENSTCYTNKQTIETDISARSQKVDQLFKKLSSTLQYYIDAVISLSFYNYCVAEADKNFRESKWTYSCERFTKLIDSGYKYVPFYNKRGLCNYNLRNYKQAIYDMTSAIDLSTVVAPDMYFNRGKCHMKNKSYSEALSDFTKAIENYPRNSSYYNNRGLAYQRVKEHRMAIEDFSKAISLSDNNPSLFNNRGSSYDNIKSYDLAIRDYTNAIKLDTNNALYYNNRGYSYQNSGKFEEAIEDYTSAIKRYPKKALYYNNRGYCYDMMNEPNKAFDEYTHAINLEPDNPVFYNNRAHALEKMGKLMDANKDRTKAKSLSVKPLPY